MLVAELKRRNVFKVATAYMVVGWIALQIAEMFFDSFGAPVWAFRSLSVVVILGFPIACLLAWAFESTPDGVVRADTVDTDAQKTRWFDYLWAALIVATLLVAAANLREDWRGPKDGSDKLKALLANEHEISIAVLPFENLSSSEENAFFAAGVHEDILTHLSKIGGMRVISRTSVLGYSNKGEKSVLQIGQELNVNRILEGSVRRAGDQVRVTVQLIDADNDNHLWSENYDRKLQNIFAVQSEVSQAVAAQLHIELNPEQAARLATAPTANIAAYDLYNQARSGSEVTGREVRRMMALLEQVIVLDPGFAPAYAQLATLYPLRALFDLEWRNVRKKAYTVAEKALQLDPLLAEAHLAMADLLRKDNRHQEVEMEIRLALSLNPNSARALQYMGVLHQRRGQYEQAKQYYLKALALNPVDPFTRVNLAGLYSMIEGETGQAESLLAKVTDLTPNNIPALGVAAAIAANQGDIQRYYDLVYRMVEQDPNVLTSINFLNFVLGGIGHHDLAAQWLQRAEAIAPRHDIVYVMRINAVTAPADQTRAYVQQQLDMVEEWLAYNPDSPEARRYLSQAQDQMAARLRTEGKITEADRLRQLARDNIERSVQPYRQSDGRFLYDGQSAWALTGYAQSLQSAGKHEEAEALIQQLLIDTKKSTVIWAPFHRAMAYAMLNDRENSLKALELAYQRGWIWVWIVENSAVFDPFRADIRYIDIMARMQARNKDAYDYVEAKQTLE
jgi:TolB-like protein/predicted Zn-dependent protease